MSTLFERNSLRLRPLHSRIHDLRLEMIRPLLPVDCETPALKTVAGRIWQATEQQAAVVLMMGAHVLRAGVQRYLIDLIEKGRLSCIAVNGAAVIHDYEFSLLGATTESVSRYISEGQFGLWQELTEINDIVKQAARERIGLGEAVGRAIEEQAHPHRDISLFAAAYRNGVPVTVHVGIGYDIVHELPNCDGGAYGDTSYRDFLRLAGIMERLEHGVVMNFGSAVMAPEIFLKALAMVRNAARREDREIRRFTTLVCDLHELPEDFRQEPQRNDPAYFFRPWKTMLVRTVADGGESFYVRGDHARTIPQLWTALDDYR